MQYLLRKRAIPLVIHTLRAIHSNEVLQLKGLTMLQTLAQTTEGWQQISETKGGWQAICQGTALGDQLIHDLPGYMHNPGWAVGESPHMPMIEREKKAVAEATIDRKLAAPKEAWTSHSLREYMGLAMRGQSLSINNESHEIYFSLLKTLDLLPFRDEAREYWYQRVSAYEREMQIRLEEMAETVLAIKHKETNDIKSESLSKLNSKEDEVVVKPVYVMGNKITGEFLTRGDMDVKERLEGIV